MGETIIKLTPFIIGSAVVPLQLMMIILLLSSPRQGLAKAIWLVAGMTAIRLLQGVIFGLILSPQPAEASGKSSVVSTLLIVLGVLLLITAYRQWNNEDDPDSPPPKSLAMIDNMTPLQVFGMGASLVLISGKFWVFTMSAIGVIGEAQLGQPSSTLAFLFFILLAQSLLLLTILVRVINPEQSKSIFESISAWLTRYNRPIVMAVSLVFGFLFFVQGVSGLLQFRNYQIEGEKTMILLDILLIASGVFLLVYGGLLFRFALAVGAFVLGFSISMWLLSSQPLAARLLISLVAGGIIAFVVYMLVKMILHFAGGILGAMLALVILSLLPVSLPNALILIVVVAGAGVVGFFGNRLGDWVIILATTLAGAYAILLGLAHLFPLAMGVGPDYLSARIPFTAPAFLVFVTFLITGILAQFEIRRVRGRYVNLR